MAAEPVIDLSALIDRRGITRFHMLLFALTILIVLADGYDVVCIAYVAPVLLKEWHFSPALQGLLFGSGFLGGMAGPPLFGYLADRFGRKYTTIFGTAFFGLFTLFQVWATDLDQLIVLRLIAGIGISGILPTIIALNAEYAPRRLQSAIAIVSFIGIAIGGLVAGLVAVGLIRDFGWQIVFWIGGLVPLGCAILGIFVFPESIKFLSLQPQRRFEMFVVLAKLVPGEDIPADAVFTISGEINKPKIRIGDLFEGKLALITPLLWLLNVLTLIVFFVVNQWMPTLLASQGYPVEQAQWGTIILQIGNIIGALILAKPLAKWGYWPVAIGCGLSVPFLAILGVQGLSLAIVFAAIFISGMGISWLQFGNIAVESQVYSTYTRSWGIGLCVVFLRLGALIGPVATGFLRNMNLPWVYLFMLVAGVQALNCIAALIFSPLYRKRMDELNAAGGEHVLLPLTGH